MEVGDKIKTTKAIFDDGEDHHPPGYICSSGVTLVIRGVQQSRLSVSHEHVTDNAFYIYPGEYELLEGTQNE